MPERRCEGVEIKEDDMRTVQRSAACERARRIAGNGPCERCGSPSRDVHHRDGDWRNNAAANLERLCRSCHVTEHNRRRQLAGVTA